MFDLFVIVAPTSSDEFQEVDGESEERRRARLERHQRTRERAVMFCNFRIQTKNVHYHLCNKCIAYGLAYSYAV